MLVLHDWGGPLGSHYALEAPDNVRAIAAMETFPWRLWRKEVPVPFRIAFRAFRVRALGYVALQVLNRFVRIVMPATAATRDGASREARAQYRAFYPTIASRKAIRRWPAMLPLDPAEPTYVILEGIERRLPTLDVPMLWLKGCARGDHHRGAVAVVEGMRVAGRDSRHRSRRALRPGGAARQRGARALDDWLPIASSRGARESVRQRR